MARSIKFRNNTFLDSKGVVHNRVALSGILNRTLFHFNGNSSHDTETYTKIFKFRPMVDNR